MLPASPLQQLDHPYATDAGVELYCKRDDLYAFDAGSPLQGNKVRKLWPYLSDPASLRGRRVVSFGGAFSNHLAALATAGLRFGFATRFIVRGEPVSNPVLDYLRAAGSELYFVSRSEYRRRHDEDYLRGLAIDTSDILIPEGGSTTAALGAVGKAFTETVDQLGEAPTYFCLSAGTGCTAAGIVDAASGYGSEIEVYPALKGDWMLGEIATWLERPSEEVRVRMIYDYTYGGYAKFPPHWRLNTPDGCLAKRADIGIAGLPPLEPVYTAKLFAGVMDRIAKGAYAPGSTLVILHTGGIY